MDAHRPKLLLLVTSSAWGGAEAYVARLAHAAEAEFDVTVAAGPSERPELFRHLPTNVKSVTIDDLRQPIAPLHDLRAVTRLRRLIDEEKFDVVHTNSTKAGLLGALAAACSRTKPDVIYTAHGWGFLERRSALFRLAVLWSEKIAAHFRAATIVLSEAERKVALRERLSAQKNLHLIPNGIDRDAIDFLDRENARDGLERLTGSKLGGTLVGVVANAYPSKGLPLMLEAFDGLAEDLPDTDLVILGDGPEMPRLRALRERLPHRDRLHLPGAVPAAARLMRAFDLFALPSLKEGFPFVILEASLAGVPILATRVGALPEIIDDRMTGRLVPPGDIKALRAAMREILTDRALLQTLKSGAPHIAERRSGADMAEATLKIYRSLTRRS